MECVAGLAAWSRRRQLRRGSNSARGQSLVEFALVVMIFLLVTVGLMDGLRVIFYYSQIQEAAREGARWGAVQVARATPNNSTTVGGTFSDTGNAPGTYCDSPNSYACPASPTASLSSSRTCSCGSYNTTIVGAVTQATNVVDLTHATITISTTISSGLTETIQTYDNHIADKPVSVSVSYPFKPILGMVFGGVTINLRGTSTMLHE